jgi:hypothetical protein
MSLHVPNPPNPCAVSWELYHRAKNWLSRHRLPDSLFRALTKPDDSGFRGFGEAWIGRRLGQVLQDLPRVRCADLLKRFDRP